MNNKLLKEYAVLWMHSQNHDNADIASTLQLSKSYVTKIINLYNKDLLSTTNDTKPNMGRTMTSKDFMINKTFGKNATGVTIMTKEASEHNDSSRNTRITSHADKTTCVFRPNDQ